SGEKQLFNLMINFSYTFLRLDKESLEKMIIFLDEIDVGFHPNWQKKVIHNLLILTNKIKEIRNDTNMKFHFIFNSHSTFLLSDLPK
ncbi:AAA family ATPase, partial [Aliarcobacter butzleri]